MDLHASDVPLAKSWPNLALEPTPGSLRSCLAEAARRGSPRAFGCLQQILHLCACHVVRHQQQVLKRRRAYGGRQEDPRAWEFSRWR